MTNFVIPSSPKEKRAFLKKLSLSVKPYVKEGTYPTINEALIDSYKKKTKAKILASFHTWKEKGFTINKGAIGYPIWSRPQQTKRTKQGEDENGDQQTKPSFFGICHLFSEDQVAKRKTNM